MGARKHIAAEKMKEARKNMYFAKLKGVPSSPRKMRYVVDMIPSMLLLTSKNCFARLLPTGKPKTTVRPKMVSYMSARSSLMKA